MKGAKKFGVRIGNRLTAEQGRGLLNVFDRQSLRGVRDYAMVAVLLGCGLRRAELAALSVQDLQQPGRTRAFADLIGKGGDVRTVPIPFWAAPIIIKTMAEAPHPWNKVQIGFGVLMGLLTLAVQQYQRHIDLGIAEGQARQHQTEMRQAEEQHKVELQEQQRNTRDAQVLAQRGAAAAEASASAARVSVELASKSLTTSNEALEFSERAWINLVSIRNMEKAFVFTFENQGRTAAYGVDTVGKQTLNHPVGRSDVQQFARNLITPPVLLNALSPQLLGPGVKYEYSLQSSADISESVVTIRYLDIFEKHRETQICYRPAPALPSEVVPCEDKTRTYSK